MMSSKIYDDEKNRAGKNADERCFVQQLQHEQKHGENEQQEANQPNYQSFSAVCEQDHGMLPPFCPSFFLLYADRGAKSTEICKIGRPTAQTHAKRKYFSKNA